MAITTWGPDLFEPANRLFWDAVREIEPSLVKAFNPWDEITTPDALGRLFERSGVGGAMVSATPGEHDLDDPGDFWDIVLGTGYRATVDALAPEQRNMLCERVLRGLTQRAVTTVRTSVVIGTAQRR